MADHLVRHYLFFAVIHITSNILAECRKNAVNLNKVLPNHLKTPIVKISSDKAINSMSKSSTFPYAFSFTEIIFSPDRSILTSFIKPLLPGIISIMHKNSRKLLFRQFANWPLMYFMFPFYFQSGKSLITSSGAKIP